MKKFIKIPIVTILLIFCLSTSVNALTAEYTDLGVPTDINTSFKTWMDWRCITDKTSDQYKCIRQWGWRDENGFMRATGEKDLGIEDDYYMIALGSYYGTTIGTKYKITTDTGNVFYGMLADQKADIHTNSTNQYAGNNDVVEFIVDTRYLRKDVRRMGSANVYMPLNGHVVKIERIDFVYKQIRKEANFMRAKRERVEMFDYKNLALRAAKDLRYPKEVIDRIKKSNDDNEISRIMTTQRQGRNI